MDMDTDMDDLIANEPERSWIRPSVALNKAVSQVDLAVGEEQLLDTAEQRYGFHIGELGLLVGSHIGAEVTPVPEAVRIPGTPPWFLGVSNLRGSLVPVFDLPRLFGYPGNMNGRENFGLVLGQGDSAVSILIEEYPQALAGLQVVSEPPPLPEALMPFVEQTSILDESLWIDFDYHRFFSSLAVRIAA